MAVLNLDLFFPSRITELFEHSVTLTSYWQNSSLLLVSLALFFQYAKLRIRHKVNIINVPLKFKYMLAVFVDLSSIRLLRILVRSSIQAGLRMGAKKIYP